MAGAHAAMIAPLQSCVPALHMKAHRPTDAARPLQSTMQAMQRGDVRCPVSVARPISHDADLAAMQC